MSEEFAQNLAGIVRVRSSVAFRQTIESLVIALERRGMAIHACVDFAKEARDIDHNLTPAQMFIFGYREAEAPLIRRCPLIAIDFPQKILVQEDGNGNVWLSYIDPLWLGRCHVVSLDVFPLLEGIANSLAGIVSDARAKLASS